ncbi:MAG: hypothetical protein H7263_03015 [Candidatus Sericytochromatia bacterium]|nr:hypothetical protein [Candidatus Sericytochromatia bacterium]
MINKKLLGLSLALLVNISLISGCATQPNMANTNDTTANSSSTLALKSSMMAYTDDETTLRDSEAIANASFKTKSVLGSVTGSLSGNTSGSSSTNGSTSTSTNGSANTNTSGSTSSNSGSNTNAPTAANGSANTSSSSNNGSTSTGASIGSTVDGTLGTVTGTNTNVDANTNTSSSNSSNSNGNGSVSGNTNSNVKLDIFSNLQSGFRKELISSGAINVSSDGSVTLDQNKYNQQRDSFRNSLQSNIQVVNNLSLSLRRNSNSIITNSNVDIKDNGDGTTTRTSNIQFKNSNNLNITRGNIFSITSSADGTVISREHSLRVTNDLSVRTVNRIILNDRSSSSIKVLTYSTTTFKNGSTRVLYEERTLDTNGSGTGKGTLTVNNGNTTKTYNLETKVTANVVKSGTARTSDSKSSVSFITNADGSFTQTSTTDGKTDSTQDYTLDTADSTSLNAQSQGFNS